VVFGPGRRRSAINDIEYLRHLIEKTLLELGIPDAQWSCVKATSFGQEPDAELSHDGILVVWLTDRNVIEFHGENGDLLKTVSLSQEDVECGRAA
jgi:hypothetical protein